MDFAIVYYTGGPPAFFHRQLLLEIIFAECEKEQNTERAELVLNEVLLEMAIQEKLWKGEPVGC